MWWMPLVTMAASALAKSNQEKEARQLELNGTLDNIRQAHASSYGGPNYGKFVSQMVQRNSARDRESSNNIGSIIQGISGAFGESDGPNALTDADVGAGITEKGLKGWEWEGDPYASQDELGFGDGWTRRR